MLLDIFTAMPSTLLGRGHQALFRHASPLFLPATVSSCLMPSHDQDDAHDNASIEASHIGAALYYTRQEEASA